MPSTLTPTSTVEEVRHRGAGRSASVRLERMPGTTLGAAVRWSRTPRGRTQSAPPAAHPHAITLTCGPATRREQLGKQVEHSALRSPSDRCATADSGPEQLMCRMALAERRRRRSGVADVVITDAGRPSPRLSSADASCASLRQLCQPPPLQPPPLCQPPLRHGPALNQPAPSRCGQRAAPGRVSAVARRSPPLPQPSPLPPERSFTSGSVLCPLCPPFISTRA